MAEWVYNLCVLLHRHSSANAESAPPALAAAALLSSWLNKPTFHELVHYETRALKLNSLKSTAASGTSSSVGARTTMVIETATTAHGMTRSTGFFPSSAFVKDVPPIELSQFAIPWQPIYPNELFQLASEGQTVAVTLAELASQLHRHLSPAPAPTPSRLVGPDWYYAHGGIDPRATALHIACAMGSTLAVKVLLAAGACPFVADSFGRLPLHLAVLGGWEETCRALLEHTPLMRKVEARNRFTDFADSFSRYENALEAARIKATCALLLRIRSADEAFSSPVFNLVMQSVVVDHVDFVQNDGASAFDLACELGFDDCARVLDAFRSAHASKQAADAVSVLETITREPLRVVDADVSAPQVYRLAVAGALADLTAALDKDASLIASAVALPRKATLMHAAARHGHEGVVELLLSRGASPNVYMTNGWTPLMLACEHGHWDIVSRLLEADALVNASCADSEVSPLHLILDAPRNGASSARALSLTDPSLLDPVVLVETMLQKGAFVNAIDNVADRSPLAIAAMRGHQLSVHLLLRSGANPEHLSTLSREGVSPLLLAADRGHVAVVSTMLEAVVSPSFSKQELLLALMSAAFHNHMPVARALLAFEPRLASLRFPSPQHLVETIFGTDTISESQRIQQQRRLRTQSRTDRDPPQRDGRDDGEHGRLDSDEDANERAIALAAIESSDDSNDSNDSNDENDHGDENDHDHRRGNAAGRVAEPQIRYSPHTRIWRGVSPSKYDFPFVIAVANKHTALAKLLLEAAMSEPSANESPSVASEDPCVAQTVYSAVCFALMHSDFGTARMLLETLGTLDPLCAFQDLSTTILQEAILTGELAMVELVLELAATRSAASMRAEQPEDDAEEGKRGQPRPSALLVDSAGSIDSTKSAASAEGESSNRSPLVRSPLTHRLSTFQCLGARVVPTPLLLWLVEQQSLLLTKTTQVCDMVKLLLVHGADAHAVFTLQSRNILHFLQDGCPLGVVEALFPNKDDISRLANMQDIHGQTPLHILATHSLIASHTVAVVRFLLEHGARPLEDAEKTSPLLSAAMEGTPDVLEVFVTFRIKADPAATPAEAGGGLPLPISKGLSDELGDAFGLAVRFSNLANARLLLSYGANPFFVVPDAEYNVLHHACSQGSVAVAAFCMDVLEGKIPCPAVSAGLIPNNAGLAQMLSMRNSNNMSPLMLAASKNLCKVVCYVCDRINRCELDSQTTGRLLFDCLNLARTGNAQRNGDQSWGASSAPAALSLAGFEKYARRPSTGPAAVAHSAPLPLGGEPDLSALQCMEVLIKFQANLETRHAYDTTVLFEAVLQPRIDAARLLVRSGANVNATTSMGVTPLHHALIEGSYDMVKLLLDAGADPNAANAHKQAPLHILASRSANIDVAELLISRGALVDPKDFSERTPLITALQYGREALALFLIPRSSALHPSFISRALHEGCFDLVCKLAPLPLMVRDDFSEGSLFRRVFGAWSLCKDVQNGMLKIAHAVLCVDADSLVSTVSWKTALFLACTVRNLDMVKLVLARKRNVLLDANGDMCLSQACLSGDVRIAQLLLTEGVRVNPALDGSADGNADGNADGRRGVGPLLLNPLEAACKKRNRHVAALLVRHGADVNAATRSFSHRFSPLHIAANAGDIAMLTLLARAGANVDAVAGQER